MRPTLFACALVVSAALAPPAPAGFLPYPTPGVENRVPYTFTASATGHVIAYFVGSTAAFDNTIGLSVNGGPVASFGLDNHSSAHGQSFDMGMVNAGDSLVFVMHNVSPGLGNLFSDPSLNGPYDGEPGHNHIYSTPFTTDGVIPDGTFVSFEDLPLRNPPDWNYNDEDFAFTNVTPAVGVPGAPEPATITLLGIGLGCLGARAWRRRTAR
jgi:hypothetical protein